MIPRCGHAPQIEKSRLVNQLISRYLRDRLKTIPPALDPTRFLIQSTEPVRARAGFLPTPLPFSFPADERFHAYFSANFSGRVRRLPASRPAVAGCRETTVRNIDWTAARTIVELGAGTGPITHVIARNAAPACRVIVVERDPDFVRLLRERFGERPNFDIVQGNVRDLASLLADLGVDRVDHVVSGLPVPSLPLAVQQALFQAVGNVLRSDGTFNQITEIPWLYWRFYRRHFDDVQFVFEPRNLPPAGAYFCRGSKA